MNRTQISLTEAQHSFLLRLSRETGESIAAIIRRAVDQMRQENETPSGRAQRMIGAFEADASDVSVHHDTYLWGSPSHGKKGSA